MESERAILDVEAVGGIDRTSVTLTPGVTVLAGRNATNRTSFLQATMAALGSDRATLKADADEGYVTLELGGDAYERRLERENGGVVANGSAYLDDPGLADLFAFLLEDNDARRSVERGDDLRDLIMRPVDTEEIEREIRDLEEEKQRLGERLEELKDLEQRLPELEERRRQLREDLDEKRSELNSERAKLEQTDTSVDEERRTKEKLESRLDELREARSELEDVQYELETERDSLASIREERDSLESEYEELPETPTGELEMVENRLDELHERKQSLTTDLNQLQSIIQFNEDLQEDADSGLLAALNDVDDDGGNVTDQLVESSSSVTCWTCGSQVGREKITGMVDELREFRQRKLQDRRDIEVDIDDLQSEKRDLKQQQRRREQVERQLDEYDNQMTRTNERIDDLETREDELSEQIDELKEVVDELERVENSELLDRQKQVSQLKFEVKRIEGELDDVESEIASIENSLEDRTSVADRREAVEADLEGLRTKVDRIEQETVETFNDHMEVVLEKLGFENLERVWLERVAREVRDGRRKVEKSTFDLHVVRKTNSDTVYEDTADHLSESEREVVGLVFALAGYLVHDVHETVPFMLLDSMEAIDAERIAAFVDYFSKYASYLVVALLPEDAAALDDGYARVTEI